MHLLLQLAAVCALVAVAGSAAAGRDCELPAGNVSEPQPPPEQHPNRAIVEGGFGCGVFFSRTIVGGDRLDLDEHPWAALLGYSVGGSSVRYECSGALISDQHVLTAAHCVSNLPSVVELRTVRLGDYDPSQTPDCRQLHEGSMLCNNPQNFGISKVMVHGDYHVPSRYMNDIALLKLDRPVIEDDFIRKICLPFDEARLVNYTGVRMTLVGFGQAEPSGDSASSDRLRRVRLPGVGQRSCAETICRLGGALGPGQICAGGEVRRDRCLGMPGGLLIANGKFGPPFSLIGINSGVSRCGISGVPSIYTRISMYLNWILDRIDD